MFVEPIYPIRKPAAARFEKRESQPRKLLNHTAAYQTRQGYHLLERIAYSVRHEMSVETLRSCRGEIGSVAPMYCDWRIQVLRFFINRVEVWMIQVLAIYVRWHRNAYATDFLNRSP